MDRLVIDSKNAIDIESPDFDKTNPQHLVQLGLQVRDEGEFDVAEACFIRALGIDPLHEYAHLSLAEVLLAKGHYAAGWREWEWRNRAVRALENGWIPRFSSMHWNGMPLPEGRLLLLGDQGFGDCIQFARYIPMAAKLVGELLITASAELKPLLNSIPGVVGYEDFYEKNPGHAAHCMLTSLPYLFDTRLDSIPNAVPYLKTSEEKMALWGRRLDHRLPTGHKRIGLQWAGRPRHPNDAFRSMPLSNLLSLTHADVVFVSLQKEPPDADREVMGMFPGMCDWSDELVDLGDTAALIQHCDLVITVDSVAAHLAGAFGVPVWNMLHKPSDWRWLLNRDDSPWYPTMRLFRQRNRGDWRDVIRRVTDELIKFA